MNVSFNFGANPLNYNYQFSAPSFDLMDFHTNGSFDNLPDYISALIKEYSSVFNPEIGFLQCSFASSEKDYQEAFKILEKNDLHKRDASFHYQPDTSIERLDQMDEEFFFGVDIEDDSRPSLDCINESLRFGKVIKFTKQETDEKTLVKSKEFFTVLLKDIRDQKVLGLMVFKVRESKKRVSIIRLAIDPQKQKIGIGSLFLMGIIKLAKQLRIMNITLNATHVGMPVYLKAGFQPLKNAFELNFLIFEPIKSFIEYFENTGIDLETEEGFQKMKDAYKDDYLEENEVSDQDFHLVESKFNHSFNGFNKSQRLFRSLRNLGVDFKKDAEFHYQDFINWPEFNRLEFAILGIATDDLELDLTDDLRIEKGLEYLSSKISGTVVPRGILDSMYLYDDAPHSMNLFGLPVDVTTYLRV